MKKDMSFVQRETARRASEGKPERLKQRAVTQERPVTYAKQKAPAVNKGKFVQKEIARQKAKPRPAPKPKAPPRGRGR